MSHHPAFVASSPALLSLAESTAADWRRLGVRGHLLARNIDTGDQFGFDADVPVPLASVAKVPIALAVLERAARGSLDLAQQVTVDPATSSIGGTGLGSFRYPAVVAVSDLLFLMLTISDNAAADALLELVGVDAVEESLRSWQCQDIHVRHRMNRMYECAAGASGDDFGMALQLAVSAEGSGVHSIETLDPAYANVASASALVDLLQRVWLDQVSEPPATAELRTLMGKQVFTNRLSSDLRTDTVRVSGKTGTFLHLRHEIGVIESTPQGDGVGDRIAIAALTRSTRRASLAQDIDLAIGAAARDAYEALRR